MILKTRYPKKCEKCETKFVWNEKAKDKNYHMIESHYPILRKHRYDIEHIIYVCHKCGHNTLRLRQIMIYLVKFKKYFKKLNIIFYWRSKYRPWGRFGGGWNFNLGIEIGSSTIILNLIWFFIRFNIERKPKKQYYE